MLVLLLLLLLLLLLVVVAFVGGGGEAASFGMRSHSVVVAVLTKSQMPPGHIAGVCLVCLSIGICLLKMATRPPQL